MKNILFTILGILLFGAIQAQTAGWQVTGSQYEYSMTMSAGVQMEGTSYGAANDYLAAFVNGTCRGVAEATWVDSYSRYMFFLTVFSNDYSGEEITFKFYSASNDSVYTGFQTETFENGANLGTASDLYQVSDQVQVSDYEVGFTITDGSNPVEGASIDIAGQVVTTDAEGKATIQLEDGSYHYDVEATGFNQESGSLSVSGASVHKTIVLEETLYQVTFNVTDGSVALANAEIIVNGTVLTTDGSGNATAHLTHGVYEYKVSYPGYNQVTDSIAVESQSVVESIALSEKMYTLQFTVSHELTALEGATIDIGGTQLTTDASGQAAIDLVNGSYGFTITKPGYQDVSGTLEVSGANIMKEVNLTKRAYTVTFSVNHNGMPQEGAVIQINETTLYTDAAGLSTTELVNGVYHYTVTTDSLRTYRDSLVVSNQDTNEAISLSGLLYTLNFHVTYNGNPLPGATVAVDALESMTDDTGHATFKLEKGVYEYKVTSDTLAPDSGLVSITTDPFTKEVQLQEKTYAATFWVNHNDAPIEGAEVAIDNQQLITDGEGSAVVELVDGTYDYTVTREGFGVVNDSLEISSSAVDEFVELSNETFKVTWKVQCDTGSLANAQVHIQDTTLLTDTAGVATLELFNGIYDYTVTKQGFGTVKDTVMVSASSVSQSVKLSDDQYKLSFAVKSDTGFIPQAEIHILDTTLLTDAAGEAQLQLFNGTYNYQVVKEGYGIVNHTIDIHGADVNRTITLSDERFELSFEVQYDNAPIEDAQIHIHDSVLVTDASGQATISLLSGTYDYRVVKHGYEPDSNSVRIDHASLSRAVTLDPVTHPVDFAVLYNSKPVENAVITINQQELVTDTNGVATIQLIDGGYAYRVSADGLLDTTGSFTVEGAAHSEEIALSSPAYEVTLGVYHETTPVSGADILLNGEQVTTNQDGMATMELEKGVYAYEVSAEHFETATGSLEVVNADLTKNILVSDIKYGIALVVNHDSQPVEGAQVHINNESLTTDANGQVVIRLENGVYDYSVIQTGFKKATGSITVDHSDVVQNVFLSELTQSVLFSVSFESEPVDSALISIEDTTLITGMDGMAEIELVNGDYPYTVTADSLEQAQGSISVNGSPVVKNIALVPVTYEVTFSVNQGDQPVSDATITIGNIYRVTDEEGKAVVSLENGQYGFNCYADNYENASGSITISGEPKIEIIQLKLTTDIEVAEQARLKVYPNPVKDKVHISVPVASVSLMNMEGQVVFQQEGEINGFDASRFEAGLYLLKIQTKDRSVYTKKLIIR